MATQKFAVYVHKNLETHHLPGKLWIAENDLSGSEYFKAECVLVSKHEIELDVPEIDTRQAAVEALQARIEKERADSQVRVNLLMELISKLQAIGHEVAE